MEMLWSETSKITVISGVQLLSFASAPPTSKQSIDATVRHMDTFAEEGLRTLVVAQAELDPQAFEEWADRYEEVGGVCV